MRRLSANFGKVLLLFAANGIIEIWIIAFPIFTVITICFAVCWTKSDSAAETGSVSLPVKDDKNL